MSPRIRSFAPAPLPIAAALALLLAAAAGCRPQPEEIAVEEEAIQAALRTYASRLSQAYAFTDATLLESIASQREIAAVQRNVESLAAQGQRIATDLKEMSIEELTMSDLDHAHVQTFEVWEIRVMDLGSERVISVDPDQRNRVRYQLEREAGEWRVLWRQRIDDRGGAGDGGGAGGDAGGA